MINGKLSIRWMDKFDCLANILFKYNNNIVSKLTNLKKIIPAVRHPVHAEPGLPALPDPPLPSILQTFRKQKH